MEQLTIADIDIDVTLKDIKNIHLSVHPPYGSVTISAPKHTSPDVLRFFAIGKLGWIRKERKKFLEQPRESEKEYITQESHWYMGKRYLLQVKEGYNSKKVILRHNHIELQVPKGTTAEKKQALLYSWYRKQLRALLSELVAQWENRMELESQGFGIRKMKTKWGSCNNDNGNIWFNIELIKKPVDCIEYVVVHELVHLLERNHNKRFVMLMNKFLPGWIERKRELNGGEI